MVERALRRWPQLYAAVEAVRPAFIYQLGTRAAPPALPSSKERSACDATHALLAVVRDRLSHERLRAASLPRRTRATRMVT